MPFKYSGFTLASLEHPDRNEDAIGFDAKTNWVAVLDGVGGMARGDLASQTAIEVVGQRLANIDLADLAKVERKLKEVIEEASIKVSAKVPEGATTAVFAKLVEAKKIEYAMIGSVGDSRAYLFRKRGLKQITEDDSVIPSAVSRKLDEASSVEQLTAREMNFFMRRNVITQALGSGGVFKSHLYRQSLAAGDKLVLTTDGVHDNLTRSEMETIVRDGGEVARNLVNRAQVRSQEQHFRAKPDDMSAVVVEVK